MDKKAELLAEARQVFAEKGYNKTNISDIAKRVRDCLLALFISIMSPRKLYKKPLRFGTVSEAFCV